MTHDTPDRPTPEGHAGLDNDEATAAGKMMTAEGSTGGTSDAKDAPTLEDHPGLDDDEATDEGKMMTAEGSIGAQRGSTRAQRESTGPTAHKDDSR
jgi:hypothetical protein